MNKKLILAIILFVVSLLLLVFVSCCTDGKNDNHDRGDLQSISSESDTPDETKESTQVPDEKPLGETPSEPEKKEETLEEEPSDVTLPEQVPTENEEEPVTEPVTEPEPAQNPTETQNEPSDSEPSESTQPPQNQHVPVTSITLTTYDVTLNVGNKTMPIVTMHPENASDKGEIWVSSDTSVATVNRYGNITGVGAGKCVVTVTSTDNSAVYADVNVTVNAPPVVTNTENTAPQNTECTYIDGILIANKTYPLPQSYAPGWDPEASSQLQVMYSAAKKDGINLFTKSGYRSYVDQKVIYNGYVQRDGKAAADTYSARPGHSEHQTGLAFDLNSTSSSFANTPEAKWIEENCYKYGFILRYPKDKEHITGYIYEPWHVRYLGVEKATEVFESGLCLEEFLGITSVYSY